jgi:plastocyanin
MAGLLTLAALAPASAQIARPFEFPSVRDHTGAIINGVVGPDYYSAPQMMTTWVVPQYTIYYQAPQPFYVALPAPRPPQPAVTTVSTAVITLRAGTAPTDLRVKPGTVVIWLNATERERAIVVRPASTDVNSGNAPRGEMVRSNATFSLVFREPGSYEFYFQDEPKRHARLVVAE